MVKRALVVASATGGLTGPDRDADRMRLALEARGFVVELRARGDATRAGILDGYKHLIASCTRDDAAVVYYSGHGGYTITSEPRDPIRSFQNIVPFDYDQSSELDYRGISSWELSILLRRLTAKTRNTTVILDCCHSSQMTRDGADHDATVRALPHPLTVSIEKHRAALAELYTTELDALGFSEPDAVRIVACGQSQVAYEYTSSPGLRTGAMTEAFLQVLGELGDAPVSWSLFVDNVRKRVLAKFPSQRPDVEGPAGRQLFSEIRVDSLDAFSVRADNGRTVMEAGRLHAVQVGDRFDIAAASDLAHPTATAEVISLEATTSILRLDPAELPPAPTALPRSRQALRRPVRLRASDEARAALTAELEATRTLRVAGPGDVELATLSVDNGTVAIVDRVGALLPPAGDTAAARREAVRVLSNLGVAQAVRELAGSHGLAAERFEIELATVVDGKRHPIADSGANLSVGDRLCCRIKNNSNTPVWAHVFNIGISGNISYLIAGGTMLMSGQQFWIDEAMGFGNNQGLPLYWPAAVPKELPRVDTLFVIITTQPANLTALETQPAGVRGAMNGTGGALGELLDQLYTGQTREIGGRAPDAYFAKKLDYTLHPVQGAIASEDFQIALSRGNAPATRSIDAWRANPQPRPPTRVAVRLAELVIDDTTTWFPADVMVSAVVCTRARDPEATYHVTSTPFERVRDGERLPLENLLLFSGDVQDFVDICLWVAIDNSKKRALSDVLGQRRAELDEAKTGLIVAAGIAGPWAAAAGASAMIARVVYDAMAAISPRRLGLFRTTFLSTESFGVGRYPATGRYHAQDISFALSIETLP